MHQNMSDMPGKELAKLVAGDRIGFGMSREVYEYELDRSLVIKLEMGAKRFQNVKEWEFWEEVSMTPWAKWFAPCVEISPSGLFLIQKRTTPAPKHKFPDKIPAFLSDLKYSNFGLLVEKGQERLVCHDYGSLVLTNGFSKKMKKADWSDS